jgi:hypothetical protein
LLVFFRHMSYSVGSTPKYNSSTKAAAGLFATHGRDRWFAARKAAAHRSVSILGKSGLAFFQSTRD